uniref:Uncharacterized protein n=1 Tax=Myoviridae sp. ctgXL3 TaxID=2826681 RepID=A0A8S5QRT0_9CAUD|nr:MAG TPA: hypothetical protein [Myoviridae sp. ctgXL3]
MWYPLRKCLLINLHLCWYLPCKWRLINKRPYFNNTPQKL